MDRLALERRVKDTIREVKDFPKEGIMFKDITPILEDSKLTRDITFELVSRIRGQSPDAIMGIESRGFFWGVLMAQELNVPFIPVRKKGKLPYKTISHKYDLEYGSAEIEVHQDVIQPGMKVLIHDDLLATGGTAEAAANLIEKQEADIAGFSFLVILESLMGRERLVSYSQNIDSIVTY